MADGLKSEKKNKPMKLRLPVAPEKGKKVGR